MKAARPYPRITITPKGEAALTGGHPWVYEGEVTAADGTPEDGGLVDVVSRRGSWLGCGFYNSHSRIRVRAKATAAAAASFSERPTCSPA